MSLAPVALEKQLEFRKVVNVVDKVMGFTPALGKKVVHEYQSLVRKAHLGISKKGCT